jgi:predicted RNase H-like HicB family nuclease
MNKVTIVILSDRPGEWAGYIKELPGIVTQGKSEAELRNNLKDAAAAMFSVLIDEAHMEKSRAEGWSGPENPPRTFGL